ncbi:MAG: T9SS type A sorting domain-containing protein [Bacteroidia bacterium]|nr:T9SS type A sorting domain-containing protein [Bacteroidia bacterium]
MKKILLFILLTSLSFHIQSQIISQYVESNNGSHPKLIEIYNNTGSTLDFNSIPLKVYYASNAGSESLKETISDGELAPGSVLVIGPASSVSNGTWKTQVLANNPNVKYVDATWQFNGNDHIRLEYNGNTTDTFGRVVGNDSYSNYGGVSANNSNISRRLGHYSGDTDYWAANQTGTDNLSLYWEETVDFASGYPTWSDAAAALVGVGVPPDNYVYDSDGNWNSWNSGTSAMDTSTSPSSTGSESIIIGSGSYSISATGSSFANVQVNTGATFNIDAGKELSVSGRLVNNGGTINLNSDSNEFSSLILSNSAIGNVIYNRWVNGIPSNPTAEANDSNPGWDLIGSPLLNATVNGNSFAQNGSNYAFQPYNNTDNSWTPTTESGNISTSTAVGYSAATTSAGAVAFTGSPSLAVNTDISITETISSGGTQWNLVSNPFPNYISLNGPANSNSSSSSAFLWYNTNGDNDVLGYTDSEEAIWYWDGTDYITVNSSSTAKVWAAPGQAFFISSKAGGGILSFRSGNIATAASVIAASGGDDFISGNSMDPDSAELFLTIYKNNLTYSTEIYFNDNGTDSVDPGYDSRTFPSSSNSIYTRLISNDEGVNMAIQTLNFDEINNKVIPLGINAVAGEEAIISISHNTTNPSTYIYLEDALEGTFTNLKETDFVITPDSNLEGVGRFFIHTTASTMSNEDATSNLLNVFKLTNNNFITVEGLSTQSNQTNLKLYNILGKEVLSTTLANNTNTQTVSTQGLSAGIYVIKLESGNNTITKKLIIK